MGDIKIFNIKQLRDKFKIRSFFETGTLYGDTIDYYQEEFDVLISVEIDKELAEKAQKRFKDNYRIKIINDTSKAALEEMLPRFNTNILFWLDAHFPGADAHKVAYDAEQNQDTRLPLEKELETIVNLRKNYGDVIIIDDLWLYEDGPFEWGSFDNHMKSIGSDVTRASLGVKNSDFIYNLIKDKYDYKKDYHHQGYLIIYPK